MHADRTRKASERSSGEVRVRFSPQVKAAFANLAASVHFSEHFDSGIRGVVQDWTQDKAVNVRDILMAFPAIAGETFKHIQATGDERAREAWDAIRNQMAENGFTLSMKAAREK